MRRASAWPLIPALLLNGCIRSESATRAASVRSSSVRHQAELCLRTAVQTEGPYHQELPGEETEAALRAELDTLPPPVRRTALAAGIEPLLARLLRERREGDALSARGLAMRQDLSAWLASLASQLSAITFEADCTGDQLSSLLLRLERAERDRTFSLTLASLISAAVFATASAAWQLRDSDSNGPEALALAGGTTSSALALAALLPERTHVSLGHGHNLLVPVLEGTDPGHLYPAFVFRLLTLPAAPNEPTPREALLQRCRALIAEVFPPEERAEVEQLMFGSGGTYDAKRVDLRERIYDELESTLDAQARDLELLNRVLVRLLNAPQP